MIVEMLILHDLSISQSETSRGMSTKSSSSQSVSHSYRISFSSSRHLARALLGIFIFYLDFLVFSSLICVVCSLLACLVSLFSSYLPTTVEQFGAIIATRIQMDRETGRSRGIGYVEFETEESATKAFDAGQQKRPAMVIDGREVRVDYATQRAPNADARAKVFGDKRNDPSVVIWWYVPRSFAAYFPDWYNVRLSSTRMLDSSFASFVLSSIAATFLSTRPRIRFGRLSLSTEALPTSVCRPTGRRVRLKASPTSSSPRFRRRLLRSRP